MENNHEKSRVYRRNQMTKRKMPSIKSRVIRLSVIASVLLVILLVTHNKWMASLNAVEPKTLSTNIDTANDQQSTDENADHSLTESSNEETDDSEANGANNENETEGGNETESTDTESTEEDSEASNQVNEEESEATENEQESSNNNSEAAEEEEEEEELKIIAHIVKENETLYKIAMRYYGNKDGVQIIKDYNQLENNNIYVGQQLKIPVQN
jgi:LysM repeat protein